MVIILLMDKRLSARDVVRIAAQMGITRQEIMELPEDLWILPSGPSFDLLCLVNNRLQRLPFDKGRYKNPVGIFPFADSPCFFELEEKEDIPRKLVKEARLPSLEFCERAYKVKNGLNTCLKLLHKPILQGSYYAVRKFPCNVNWIVSFDDCGNENLPSDFYGDSELAKVRYCGYWLDGMVS